jgi:Fe-S cluster assembly scaffold protein SufB
MPLSQILPITGTLASLVGALVVVLAAFRTSAARVWREEAEAQKERADRLASDLTEIKDRLRRIEAENARLIALLTSLDPNRLAANRLATPPDLED